ncbi:MAG: hypothetical protein WDN00_14615 [Limisphaerales bacterium]
MRWQESKKSVGGDPVWPGIEGFILVPVDRGFGGGYVWQKSQVYQLSKQFTEKERRLAQLMSNNKNLNDQLADLQSPVKLDQKARGLGLVLAQPQQVIRLPETPSTSMDDKSALRQFATRLVNGTPR